MAAPKLFISYCWSSKEHEEWVLRLATELRENGVDALLDKWDLKEGHDANAFMEKMVSDADIKKVIIVIDHEYSERANKRKGGVGTETQIISAEVYESVDQNKFVAVIANRDEEGNAKLPTYYKSRIYIDLSDDDLYGKNFEQLLRWVFDKPLNVRPEIGSEPTFLDEATEVSMGTSVASRRLVDCIKNNRSNTNVALIDYFNQFSANMEKFRLPPSQGLQDFDDKVIENINQFLPARNELIEVFGTIALYDPDINYAKAIHKFFESLIPYVKRNKTTPYYEWDNDNYKFIIQEIFIICVGVFLKHERFDFVAQLLNQQYFVEVDEHRGTMASYGVFRNPLPSFENRNQRLKLNRLSVQADLIRARCSDSGLAFKSLMQADFLLYLRGSIDALKEKQRQTWWPVTLVFSTVYGAAFEIFSRAESIEYFNQLRITLGVNDKSDFEPFIQGLKNDTIYTPSWSYERIEPLELMNYEKLCSRK